MEDVPALDHEVEVLTRNCEFGDAGLKRAMQARLRERLATANAEQRGLRVYAGLDPTAPVLHLGHATLLRKLAEFTTFGHDVTVVIGTMTAMIGDMSDKASGRPARSRDEVREAAASYAEQLYRVLDREDIRVVFNDEWLATMDLSAVVQVASAFTVQQFLARESYRARLDRGDPIGLQEFLYALLQARDAVELRCDVQVGGTDQLFNILAGARLQEVLGQPPSVALTLPLLVGTDGSEKMSKSAGNTIGIAEDAVEQFGKTMAISDETMLRWAPLVSGWDAAELEHFIADAGVMRSSGGYGAH